MAIGCFTDKTHQPTQDEISSALGGKQDLWDRLVRYIAGTYQMDGEWNFGGKNYGWNLWYRRSGKSLVSLYPQQDGFVAQVVLGKDQVEKALALPLGEAVGKAVRETPQLHDGKWLFLKVSTEIDAADIEQLFMVKKRPVKQR